MRGPHLLVICAFFHMLVGNWPVQVRVWEYAGDNLNPLAAPPQGKPLSILSQADFDGDGKAECLRLQAGHAEVRRGLCDDPSFGSILWQSPLEWQVVQAVVSDLNHDTRPEVSLLVWRPFAPWPIDHLLPYAGRIEDFHDAQGQSCHLILIGWRGERYGEIWAGSALAEPLRAITAADLDGDGIQELAALESDYLDMPLHTARALSIWEWNGFGFTLLARARGQFQNMMVVSTIGGKNVIFTGQVPNW